MFHGVVSECFLAEGNLAARSVKLYQHIVTSTSSLAHRHWHIVTSTSSLAHRHRHFTVESSNPSSRASKASRVIKPFQQSLQSQHGQQSRQSREGLLYYDLVWHAGVGLATFCCLPVAESLTNGSERCVAEDILLSSLHLLEKGFKTCCRLGVCDDFNI